MKMQIFAIFVNENLEDRYAKDKKDHKVTYHCYYRGEYRGAAHSLCNLNYSIPKKLPIVFHDGSNYDYHFIIKELAEGYEKHFTCLGKILKNTYLFSSNTKRSNKKN